MRGLSSIEAVLIRRTDVMNTTPFFSTGTARRVRVLALGAIVTSVALLAGCANNSASGSVYSYGQAQREQIVRAGTITAVRPIVIQEDKTSGAGVLAGGALGGVAGNAVGGGTGRAIATVGGALLGALAGNAVENRVGRTSGLEVTVRLDNGETRVVAQEADIPLSVGQRVQVISGAGPTRVAPM
jgi:outer membrane lipoprotein SlyB